MNGCAIVMLKLTSYMLRAIIKLFEQATDLYLKTKRSQTTLNPRDQSALDYWN